MLAPKSVGDRAFTCRAAHTQYHPVVGQPLSSSGAMKVKPLVSIANKQWNSVSERQHTELEEYHM